MFKETGLIEETLQTLVQTSMFGLAFALMIGPIVLKFTRRIGIIDYPGTFAHKQHEKPTPLAGGTVLIVTLITLSLLNGMWGDETIRTIIIGALIIYLFGLADDIVGFSALPKLTGQLIAAGVLIQAGLSARFLQRLTVESGPESLIMWVDIAITVFWLTGITNAMNLIDSMDGLVAGLSIVTFLFLMLASLLSGQISLAWLSVTLASICLALLFFNSTPAKMFLGDSGAQTLGFLAAAVAMVYAPKDLNPLSTWFAPILILGLPIFDTTLVVFSRIRRKKPIYSAGLDHTYHRLVFLGIDPKRAVLILQMASVLLSGLVLILIPLAPLKANLGFGIILLSMTSLIILFEKNISH